MIPKRATLFFYDNNEYLLTGMLDDEVFRYEGIEIKNETIAKKFLNILSDYEQINKKIEYIIDYLDKECKENELYNFILKIKKEFIDINEYFDIFDIEEEILKYISDREKMRLTLTIKKDNTLKKEFVKDFFIDYILGIRKIKNLIDTYYNINNDELLSKLTPNKRIFYFLSRQIELQKKLIIPKSKQYVCIKYGKSLLPAESFIYKTNDINNIDIREIEKQYNDNSKESKVYQYVLNHKVYNLVVYEINNFWDLLNAYYYHLTTNNIQINKCKNCGKYFIPTNKNNETLCDNVYKNRKNM